MRNRALVAGLLAGLQRLGSEVRVGSPAEFAAFLAQEKSKWDDLVRRTGIKME